MLAGYYQFGKKFKLDLRIPSYQLQIQLQDYIDTGGNINYESQSQDYVTPLQYCSKLGLYDHCKVLLGCNASVSYVNKYGETALFSAVMDEQVEICDLLIQHGADTNFTLTNGESILSFAVNLGNFTICRLLLLNRADPNYRNPKSPSPLNLLNFAAEKGLFKICKLLQDHGAKVNSTYSGPSVLFLAARDNEYDLCQSLLSQNVNVNQMYKEQTPLHVASLGGHLQICDLLINNGSSLDSKIKYQTPLMLAVQQGHQEICKLLIEKRANIAVKDRSGNSLLTLAAQNGHTHICKLLLDSVMPNQDGLELNLALLESVKKNRLNACEVLIQSGADVYFENKILVEAAKGGSYEICQLLLKHGAHIRNYQPQAEDEQKSSLQAQIALFYAVDLGQMDICSLLIDGGVQVKAIPLNIIPSLQFSNEQNQQQYQDMPLILVAARQGHLQIFNYLLMSGVDLNHKPLQQTLWRETLGRSRENLSILKFLWQAGVDLNFKFDNGNSILHVAAEGQHYQTCELLLLKGAELDILNDRNESPLFIAIKKGYLNITKLLVQYGANLNLRFQDDLPVWFLALQLGHYDICVYFFEDSAFGIIPNSLVINKTPIWYAISYGHFELVKFLIENCGAQISSEQNVGANLLYVAAESQQMEIFTYLIEQGADIDARDSTTGCTALYNAVNNGNDLICYSLIENGAKVDEVNTDGQTALMLAVSKNHQSICEFLISAGADVNHRRDNGETILKVAKKGKNREIVQLLIRNGAVLTSGQSSQEGTSSNNNLLQSLSIKSIFRRKGGSGEKAQQGPKGTINTIREIDKHMCIVCMGEAASYALIHGEEAHVCLCKNCVEFYKPKKGKKQNCPLCRKPVDATCKLYF